LVLRLDLRLKVTAAVTSTAELGMAELTVVTPSVASVVEKGVEVRCGC
jgi:hypothetical protein